MNSDRSTASPQAGPRTGLWLVGARGAISTCVAYGLIGLREGWVEPVGICTEMEPLSRLPFAPFDSFVLGGHDVCRRDLSTSAGELVAAGILPADLVTGAASEAAAFESRIRPGLLDQAEVGFSDLDPRSAELGALPPREQIAALQADWDEFERENGIERTVVVYVASTEAAWTPSPDWDELGAFETALDAGRSIPASMLYAYAALASGRPLVNFTPCLGATPRALRELALEKGVPHCGNDGKTGETLVKTVLAPMFRGRALKVLAWQGYNMLGNRDGEVLKDPSHKAAKVRHKDDVLKDLLGDEGTHSKVGIDYVPSLGDWKTAWDFIHFEGFLGARMSMQFTWEGCDSALAAPLIVDLARLAAFAAERGERGDMTHTAAFFKAPLAGGTHDFHAQLVALYEYANLHESKR